MSHDDDLINNLTYVENLQLIPVKITGVPTDAWPNLNTAMKAAITSGTTATKQTLINNFFASFTGSNKLSTSFDGFVSQFIAYVTSQGNTISGSASTTVTDGFLNDYIRWTSSDANSTPIFSGSGSNDWSLLSPVPNKADLTAQMKNWFNDFSTGITYTNSTTPIFANENGFHGVISEQLTVTAAIQAGSTLSGIPVSSNIPRYEDVYNALFPGGDFDARFLEFYNKQIAKNGFFNSSQLFSVWTDEISREFATSMGTILVQETHLASGQFKRTLVLDRIFLLLTSLLNTLQRITMLQSQRLVIFTQWQTAYTNVISQLHVFLDGDGTPAGGTLGNKDARSTVRGNLNDKVHTSWRENLQALRGMVSDDSKSLQSNINQSNDAVSQQANMATAIIQELNTLLGAIYR